MLSDNPEIDGIFAGCDTIAIGVLKALRELNKKVPDDIQLLGFDNITMSGEMVPPITTVSQPMYEMGYQAARMLLASIQDKNHTSGRSVSGDRFDDQREHQKKTGKGRDMKKYW